MICLTLRRSRLRSLAIERWLWPAVCSSRTVRSNVSVGCFLRRWLGVNGVGVGLVVLADEQHQEFEGADQRQR
jgi:hypothetical protein